MTNLTQTEDIVVDKFQHSLENAELLVKLKKLDKFVQEIFPQHLDAEVRAALGQAISVLENGEPFNPEPKPGSGQHGWLETAKMYSRNAEFYQGIVVKVGEILGTPAYTADDGTVGDSVLALKLPELIREMKDDLSRAI